MRVLAAVGTLVLAACGLIPGVGANGGGTASGGGTGGSAAGGGGGSSNDPTCTFTATSMGANISTTNLTSNSNDSIAGAITGMASTGFNTFIHWAHAVPLSGCIGDDFLYVNFKAKPHTGDTFNCTAADQGLTWDEHDCTQERAWVCSGGTIKVDRADMMTTDLSFNAVPLSPGNATAGATNAAIGTLIVTGSCRNVPVPFQ